MKMFLVGASPFARKAQAAAVEHGLFDRIERIIANPHDVPPELIAHNPLSKVPALVTDDGLVVADSTAICLYFDDIGSGPALLPAEKPMRWTVLRRHSMANGIMEASVLRRVEARRAAEPDRLKVIAKQEDVCRRTLNQFETEVGDFGSGFTLDLLTLACAVGFLDFRFPNDRWREGRPKLARWFDALADRPSLKKTMPYD